MKYFFFIATDFQTVNKLNIPTAESTAWSKLSSHIYKSGIHKCDPWDPSFLSESKIEEE